MAEVFHDNDGHAPPPPPAPPSILRSKSSSDISTASSDSKLSTITFAPLPAVAARKRRHGHPIGLASRAEMLRKTRRQLGGAHPNIQSYEEEQRTPPEDDEIPLPDLGKLVKGLWRSVSRGHGTKEKISCETPRPVVTTTFTKGINTSAEDEEDGEGGVWMEEVAWSPSDSSSPSHFHSPSNEDDVRQDSRRDTMCTVDSGSFVDQLGGNKEDPVRREAEESWTQKDVG